MSERSKGFSRTKPSSKRYDEIRSGRQVFRIPSMLVSQETADYLLRENNGVQRHGFFLAEKSD
jgi:hypothetical protein